MYIPLWTSFTSTHSIALNFDGSSLVCLANLWSSGTPFSLYIYDYNNGIFWYSIISFYDYNNPSSSIICCRFSSGLHISIDISLVEWIFFYLQELKQPLLTFSAILFCTRSPISSTVFWIAIFEAVLRASVNDFLVMSRIFCPYLLLRFLPAFFQWIKIYSLGHIWVQLKISLYTIIINAFSQMSFVFYH